MYTISEHKLTAENLMSTTVTFNKHYSPVENLLTYKTHMNMWYNINLLFCALAKIIIKNLACAIVIKAHEFNTKLS